MARLDSINKKDFLDIKINSFENKFETNEEKWNWIISRVHFSYNGKRVMNTIGSYFDLGEIKNLIDHIKNLLDKKESNFESSFLEPNLEIKINYVENEKYTIAVLFRKFINYGNGKIKDSNESTKKLRFITNHSNLTSFIENLESELKNL